ncbi:cyclin-like protein interacting with PHO85 [Dispira parvispora]|uniref:Cyclin-like protein interacting with PHO85 n=1 Tax=Dispira parvispora TaxID=1520584 RepID=A0A9W8B284_9FUNG|nr:cyclin-like protein interacting with PHO85 [Dispira parvispora]
MPYQFNFSDHPIAHTLEYVAYLLENICSANDKLLDDTQSMQTTVFHMSCPPAISIHRYLQRIAKYLKLDNRYLLMFLVYLERITNNSKGGIVITSLSLHRLVISSLVVAHKFYCDQIAPNTRYAEIGGIPLTDMNLLELEFLFMCQFDLLVPMDQLEKYGIQLWQYSLGRQVPVPPPATSSQCTSTTASSATVTRATSTRVTQERNSSLYDSLSRCGKFVNPQQRPFDSYEPFSNPSTPISYTLSTPPNMTTRPTRGDITQCTCDDHEVPKYSCLSLTQENLLPQQVSVRRASVGQNGKHVTIPAPFWGTPVTQTTHSPPQVSMVNITVTPVSGSTSTVAKAAFPQVSYDGAWSRLLSSLRSLAALGSLGKLQPPLSPSETGHVTDRVSTVHAIPSADPVGLSCGQPVSKFHVPRTRRYVNLWLASRISAQNSNNTPSIKIGIGSRSPSESLSTTLNLSALLERNAGQSSGDSLPVIPPNHQALPEANRASPWLVRDGSSPVPRRRSARSSWSIGASELTFKVNPLLLSRKRVRVG